MMPTLWRGLLLIFVLPNHSAAQILNNEPRLCHPEVTKAIFHDEGLSGKCRKAMYYIGVLKLEIFHAPECQIAVLHDCEADFLKKACPGASRKDECYPVITLEPLSLHCNSPENEMNGFAPKIFLPSMQQNPVFFTELSGRRGAQELYFVDDTQALETHCGLLAAKLHYFTSDTSSDIRAQPTSSQLVYVGETIVIPNWPSDQISDYVFKRSFFTNVNYELRSPKVEVAVTFYISFLHVEMSESPRENQLVSTRSEPYQCPNWLCREYENGTKRIQDSQVDRFKDSIKNLIIDEMWWEPPVRAIELINRPNRIGGTCPVTQNQPLDILSGYSQRSEMEYLSARYYYGIVFVEFECPRGCNERGRKCNAETLEKLCGVQTEDDCKLIVTVERLRDYCDIEKQNQKTMGFEQPVPWYPQSPKKIESQEMLLVDDPEGALPANSAASLVVNIFRYEGSPATRSTGSTNRPNKMVPIVSLPVIIPVDLTSRGNRITNFFFERFKANTTCGGWRQAVTVKIGFLSLILNAQYRHRGGRIRTFQCSEPICELTREGSIELRNPSKVQFEIKELMSQKLGLAESPSFVIFGVHTPPNAGICPNRRFSEAQIVESGSVEEGSLNAVYYYGVVVTEVVCPNYPMCRRETGSESCSSDALTKVCDGPGISVHCDLFISVSPLSSACNSSTPADANSQKPNPSEVLWYMPADTDVGFYHKLGQRHGNQDMVQIRDTGLLGGVIGGAKLVVQINDYDSSLTDDNLKHGTYPSRWHPVIPGSKIISLPTPGYGDFSDGSFFHWEAFQTNRTCGSRSAPIEIKVGFVGQYLSADVRKSDGRMEKFTCAETWCREILDDPEGSTQTRIPRRVFKDRILDSVGTSNVPWSFSFQKRKEISAIASLCTDLTGSPTGIQSGTGQRGIKNAVYYYGVVAATVACPDDPECLRPWASTRCRHDALTNVCDVAGSSVLCELFVSVNPVASACNISGQARSQTGGKHEISNHSEVLWYMPEDTDYAVYSRLPERNGNQDMVLVRDPGSGKMGAAIGGKLIVQVNDYDSTVSYDKFRTYPSQWHPVIPSPKIISLPIPGYGDFSDGSFFYTEIFRSNRTCGARNAPIKIQVDFVGQFISADVIKSDGQIEKFRCAETWCRQFLSDSVGAVPTNIPDRVFKDLILMNRGRNIVPRSFSFQPEVDKAECSRNIRKADQHLRNADEYCKGGQYYYGILATRFKCSEGCRLENGLSRGESCMEHTVKQLCSDSDRTTCDPMITVEPLHQFCDFGAQQGRKRSPWYLPANQRDIAVQKDVSEGVQELRLVQASGTTKETCGKVVVQIHDYDGRLPKNVLSHPANISKHQSIIPSPIEYTLPLPEFGFSTELDIGYGTFWESFETNNTCPGIGKSHLLIEVAFILLWLKADLVISTRPNVGNERIIHYKCHDSLCDHSKGQVGIKNQNHLEVVFKSFQKMDVTQTLIPIYYNLTVDEPTY